MSHEGIFKIIASPPLVSRIVENFLDNSTILPKSLIAFSQDEVFFIHSKDDQKDQSHLTDQKKSVTLCSLEKWIVLVENRAKKILVDPNTPAETVLHFHSLKNVKLILSEPLLEEKEVLHYFSEKTDKNQIHEKQLDLLQVSKKQIDTFSQTLLICEMAFVCNYHKIHQGVLLSEIVAEIQNYIHSKCDDLTSTQLNCRVKHYYLEGSAKKLNDKDPLADGQVIVLTISGKSHNINLEKERIVTYGPKTDEKLVTTYNETLKNYLELKQALGQQFSGKKLKKENNILSTIEKIFEKKNEVISSPYFHFSFSSNISLKYLPMILDQIKRNEIISIYFPITFPTTIMTMGHLSLHAVIEYNKQSKKPTIKILDRDNLDLLRFFS